MKSARVLNIVWSTRYLALNEREGCGPASRILFVSRVGKCGFSRYDLLLNTSSLNRDNVKHKIFSNFSITLVFCGRHDTRQTVQ